MASGSSAVGSNAIASASNAAYVAAAPAGSEPGPASSDAASSAPACAGHVVGTSCPTTPQPVWLTPAEFLAEARKRKEKRDQEQQEALRSVRRNERSPSIIEIPDSPELRPVSASESRRDSNTRPQGGETRPHKRARNEVDGSALGSEPPASAPERREAEAFFDALSFPPTPQNGGARIEEISSSPERPLTQALPAVQSTTTPQPLSTTLLAPTTRPASVTQPAPSSSPPASSQAPSWATQPSRNESETATTERPARQQHPNLLSTNQAQALPPQPATEPRCNTGASSQQTGVVTGQAASATQTNGQASTPTTQRAPADPALPQTPARTTQTDVQSTPRPDPKLEEHERRLAELEAQLRMLRELIPTPARSTRPEQPRALQHQESPTPETQTAETQTEERQIENLTGSTRESAAMDVDDVTPTVKVAANASTTDAPGASTTNATPNSAAADDQDAPTEVSQATAPPASDDAPLGSSHPVAPETAPPAAEPSTPVAPSSPPASSQAQTTRASPPAPPNTQAHPATQPARNSPPPPPNTQAVPALDTAHDERLSTLKSCLAFMEAEYRRADKERGALASENEQLRREIEEMKLANTRLKLQVQVTRGQIGQRGSPVTEIEGREPSVD